VQRREGDIASGERGVEITSGKRPRASGKGTRGNNKRRREASRHVERGEEQITSGKGRPPDKWKREKRK